LLSEIGISEKQWNRLREFSSVFYFPFASSGSFKSRDGFPSETLSNRQ
jgi:hypothetical protein